MPRRAERGPLSFWTRAAIALAALGFRALARSQRLRVVGDDPLVRGEPFVAALWHNTLYLALGLFRDRGLVVAASLTRAGDRSSALQARLGYGESVRGSSSRRPVAALAGMIRAARAGRSVAVTVDGGRGPAGKVRPGALAVGMASGHPVYPIGLAARPCLRVRSSWETVIVPLPFARVIAVVGKPICLPQDAARELLDASRAALERALHEATREAERLVGNSPEDAAR